MIPEIDKIGVTLVAISPQLIEHSKSIHKSKQFSFELLADPGNQIADAYGIKFALPESERNGYRSFGLDLEYFNGDDTWTLPLPARFVIDSAGQIKEAVVQTDHTVRPDPESVMKTIRNLHD